MRLIVPWLESYIFPKVCTCDTYNPLKLLSICMSWAIRVHIPLKKTSSLICAYILQLVLHFHTSYLSGQSSFSSSIPFIPSLCPLGVLCCTGQNFLQLQNALRVRLHPAEALRCGGELKAEFTLLCYRYRESYSWHLKRTGGTFRWWCSSARPAGKHPITFQPWIMNPSPQNQKNAFNKKKRDAITSQENYLSLLRRSNAL